jgi:hypothetical protein
MFVELNPLELREEYRNAGQTGNQPPLQKAKLFPLKTECV